MEDHRDDESRTTDPAPPAPVSLDAAMGRTPAMPTAAQIDLLSAVKGAEHALRDLIRTASRQSEPAANADLHLAANALDEMVFRIHRAILNPGGQIR